jgi:DNA-binding NtrC family response regulator
LSNDTSEDRTRLRVLVIDDDEVAYALARLLLSEIEREQFDVHWAATYDEASQALSRDEYDICLLDYHMGERDGLELLREAYAAGIKVPMILLTGQGDYNVDVEATKAGAMDYLIKGRIDSTQLERSIRYAIERRRVELQREELIRDLEDALAKIKTLRGLLPICASCKSIRDDQGYWRQIETYIHDHSDADFSHSICPTCLKQLYPNQYALMSHDEPQ